MTRTTLVALALLLLPFSGFAAPATSFLGSWSTQWQTLDQSGTIPADLVVTFDTAGERDLLDGEYTTIDATTKGPVKGWMHGHLSADGKVWRGTWWNPDAREHGDFTFTLISTHAFTGTYTQAQHGKTKFGWNGTKK